MQVNVSKESLAGIDRECALLTCLCLWIFNDPFGVGCLTPPKTCLKPLECRLKSGLFHLLLVFSCVLHNSSKDSWSLPATKSLFTAFCSVSRVQDT